MRIAFVINSIATGGAEQVLSLLLARQWLDAFAARPVLVTLDAVPDDRAMPPVERVRLASGGTLAGSAIGLRKALDAIRPDCVVSFLIRANCATVLASTGRPWARVLCERMHMSSHLAAQAAGLRLRAARAVPRLLYRRADAVLAVSGGVGEDLACCTGLSPQRIEVINNPFDLTALRARARLAPPPLPRDFVVAVGRLVPAKNMAAVIKAFARARPASDLVILGTGPQRDELERLAQACGIAAHVHLLGYQANPQAVVARARCYVSASRNEGFPNATAEAMALGVPVIATDCPSGPAELLAGGTCGMLVPMDDEAALEAAMRAMGDDHVRCSLGEAGRTRMEAFSHEAIAPQYWRAFGRAATARSSWTSSA